MGSVKALAASISVLIGSTLCASAASVHLAASVGARGPLLVDGGDRGTWVEQRDGTREEVELPEGAALGTLTEVHGGWAAAGTRRDRHGVELVALMARRGRQWLLPALPARWGAIRQEPVLLVHQGRLEGVAWLEGDHPDHLGVMAAAWDGARWHDLHQVAGPSRGSQLALSGAVLADRSWLLAWSAFDGGDDEIVFSLRRDGWSPPQRVSPNNEVPDITPALVSVGPGALLAWSRYDGTTYRMQLARFDGDQWTGERPVGSRGTVFPSWRRSGPDVSLLLFRQVAPGGWTVLEADGRGGITRRVVVAGGAAAADRPVVETARSGLVLRWPDGRRQPVEWEPLP